MRRLPSSKTLPFPWQESAIGSFQKDVRRWSSRHGRDLPWRYTREPYAILVSEFMLQQTQVTAVLPYYKEWLRRFPGFRALADASEREVLHAWQGLGYYRRARNLHALAHRICREYDGRCPETLAELCALPGTGSYTAHAILTFAFNRPVPVVETNIARLLARLFNLTEPIDGAPGRRLLWDYASRLVPKRNPAAFNSALMDLGAVVCLPRAPRCSSCPVQTFCQAPDPLTLPVKKPRPAQKKLTEYHVFDLRRGRLALQRCQKRWRGMWMLPPLEKPPLHRRPLHVSTFPFTHHDVTLKVFAGLPVSPARSNQQRFAVSALDSVPMPSPHRRALNALLSGQARPG